MRGTVTHQFRSECGEQHWSHGWGGPYQPIGAIFEFFDVSCRYRKVDCEISRDGCNKRFRVFFNLKEVVCLLASHINPFLNQQESKIGGNQAPRDGLVHLKKVKELEVW